MITETKGMILRQTKTLNGRRMILLFSETYGKISAGTGLSEKGKGKSGLALRPFTYGRYELFKSRDNYYINIGEVLKSYYKIGEDVDKYISCSYILELTEKLLTEEQPSAEMFQLLLDFFDLMEHRKGGYATLVLAYQIKALQLMGVKPQLEACTCCKTEGRTQGIFFSISSGGIICENCVSKSEIPQKDTLIYRIDFGIVDILKYFALQPLTELTNLVLEEEKQKVLQVIIKKYMAFYLDINELKSETLLESELE